MQEDFKLIVNDKSFDVEVPTSGNFWLIPKFLQSCKNSLSNLDDWLVEYYFIKNLFSHSL